MLATVKPSLPLGRVTGKVVLSVIHRDGTGVDRPFTVPVNAPVDLRTAAELTEETFGARSKVATDPPSVPEVRAPISRATR